MDEQLAMRRRDFLRTSAGLLVPAVLRGQILAPIVAGGAVSPFAAYKAALAESGSKVVHVACIGSSSTAGTGASQAAWDELGWVGLLRQELQSRYGSGGFGFIPCSRQDTNCSCRFTKAGAWGTLANWGCMGTCNTASVNTATFTSTSIYCDTVDVHYVSDPTSNSFDLSIDGGAWQTISIAAEAQAARVYTTTVAAGAHTIAVRPTNGVLFQFLGISARLGTAGVVVDHMALGGTAVGSSYLPGQLAHLDALTRTGHTLGLVCLMLTSNDYSTQTAINTFTTRTAAIIEKAQSLGASVLLIDQPYRSDVVAPTIPQTDYNAAYSALATQYKIGYVDAYAHFTTTVPRSYYVIADGIHWSDAGHRELKELVWAALSGESREFSVPAGLWPMMAWDLTSGNYRSSSDAGGDANQLLVSLHGYGTQLGLNRTADAADPSITAEGLVFAGSHATKAPLETNAFLTGFDLGADSAVFLAGKFNGSSGFILSFARSGDVSIIYAGSGSINFRSKGGSTNTSSNLAIPTDRFIILSLVNRSGTLTLTREDTGASVSVASVFSQPAGNLFLGAYSVFGSYANAMTASMLVAIPVAPSNPDRASIVAAMRAYLGAKTPAIVVA